MKVYLAAPFSTKVSIAMVASELRTAGFHVVSTWHDEEVQVSAATTGAATGLTAEKAKTAARSDLKQITECDVLIMFSKGSYRSIGHIGDEGLQSSGRHFEAGFAHANGRPIIHVGVAESIFTRTLPVRHCDNWHDAFIEVVAMREAEPKVCAS